MSRRLRRLSITEGEDRISALPDSLVHHILSFLPSKDAAATTILSKRWKPLWLSELILHFNHQPFPKPFTFSNFVNSVIANQDNTPPILSFHIKCHYYNTDIHRFDCLHNVEHLRLHVMLPYVLKNKFHNLTHLELTLDFKPERGMFKWSWLVKLLQNFPKLQTLIIHEVDTVHNFGAGQWKDPEIVPECLLSHLRTCSLRSYSRINCELQFAKYIMRNSRVLNTMTIQSAKFLDTNTKLRMSLELSLCPRVSGTCKLLFI